MIALCLFAGLTCGVIGLLVGISWGHDRGYEDCRQQCRREKKGGKINGGCLC